MADENAAVGVPQEVLEKLQAQAIDEAKQQMAGQPVPPALPDHREQLLERKTDYLNRIANIEHLIKIYDANPEVGEFLVYSTVNPI